MDAFNSFVEWFNGLVGLQYAGYGPVTAIFIGMLTVMISIKVLKLLFRPFAPLFQPAEEFGGLNPVLAQQGIRQSQLVGHNETRNVSNLFEHAGERNAETRDHFSPANDTAGMDFADALEDAWQHDQSTELREEIAPLRPSRASAARARKQHTGIKSALSDLRPTAAAAPVTSGSDAAPLICMTNFGDNSRSCGAAHRIALRLGQGVSETLARIPNLAVEISPAGNWAEHKNSVSHASDSAYAVEGSVELQDGGVHVAIAVRSSADGSHLLARDITCSPADLQEFEREVALEIASAVIAQHRPAGRSIMQRLKSSRGARAGSTYPTDRRPSPEHLHKTDLPAR